MKNTETQLLYPVLFEGDAAPVEVRDLIHLYCSDCGCTDNKKCHCLSSGMNCMELCTCSDCSNTRQVIIESSDEDPSDDENVDYDEEVEGD